jgi:hypothetical protein
VAHALSADPSGGAPRRNADQKADMFGPPSNKRLRAIGWCKTQLPLPQVPEGKRPQMVGESTDDDGIARSSSTGIAGGDPPSLRGKNRSAWAVAWRLCEDIWLTAAEELSR